MQVINMSLTTIQSVSSILLLNIEFLVFLAHASTVCKKKLTQFFICREISARVRRGNETIMATVM
jgi:hypothetical protein